MTSSARTWRASGRGCTVMPCAPASRQVRAARTMSGAWPPRELRSTAILLTLTLSTVIADWLGAGRRSSRGRFLRLLAARLGLFAQPAQFLRVDQHRFVTTAAADALREPTHRPGHQ